MRDLFCMVKARRKAEWAKAGTIAAAVYNTSRGQGKRVIRPSDFYPELDEAATSWKDLVRQVKQTEKRNDEPERR